MAKLLGRYECPHEVPLVVVDDGTDDPDTHGPWIRYRFDWEPDERAKPVLFTAFQTLLDLGYRLTTVEERSTDLEKP